jgi:hypothetical protein
VKSLLKTFFFPAELGPRTLYDGTTHSLLLYSKNESDACNMNTEKKKLTWHEKRMKRKGKKEAEGIQEHEE